MARHMQGRGSVASAVAGLLAERSLEWACSYLHDTSKSDVQFR